MIFFFMDKIVKIVKSFNSLIPNTIQGPNCINPDICKGDCCFIHMNLPKALAQELIKENYAQSEDFIRGSTFSFQTQVDLNKLRCVFFDEQINGCRLHTTKLKPPQCWMYPTGLDPNTAVTNCKKAEGWAIIDQEKAKKLQDLLNTYVTLSKTESIQENNPVNIRKRLNKMHSDLLPKLPPYKIAGIIDGWDKFSLWKSPSYSFAMQKMCLKQECTKKYLQCDQVCSAVLQAVYDFFNEFLPQYIQENGFRREYSLLEVLQWHGKL